MEADKENLDEVWLIKVDGSCNDKGSGVGIILCSLEGDEVFYVLRFEFKATDKQSEYEAFIASLRLALAL